MDMMVSIMRKGCIISVGVPVDGVTWLRSVSEFRSLTFGGL